MGIFLLITTLLCVNFYWPIAHRFIKIWMLFVWFGLLMTENRYLNEAAAISAAVSLVIIAPFVVRAALALTLRERGKGTYRLIDQFIWGCGGVFVAGTLFRQTGNIVAGSANSIGPHFCMLVLGLLCVLVAIFLRSVVQTAAAFCGAALLVLTMLSAFWFPDLVRNQAEVAANGAAFVMSSRGNPLSRQQTTYLTMPKNQSAPHAVVSFSVPDGICILAWSYSAREFRTDNRLVDSSACPP